MSMLMAGAVLRPQGLNIAPALITVSPTKTVVNPVGPLNVNGAQVTKTLPALPDHDNNGA